MKVCIFGAGAIGGFLGAKLADGGAEVSLVARGAHGEAIRQQGLRVLSNGREATYRLPCSDQASDFDVQDYVIVALKAHSVPAVASDIAAICDDGSAIVMAVNGVPWWYFYGLDGPHSKKAIESVDPKGGLWQILKPERALGCVVYPACEVREPGYIEHIDGDRFSLGEPNGEKSERLAKLSACMRDGGLKAPVKTRIRDEIWVKLWGNVAFNPLSALTGATLVGLCEQPETRALAHAMMREAQSVGEGLGVKFAVDIERRIDGAAAVGAHKTSMLQDLELGRPMEIDAIVTAVQELGVLQRIPTPTIDLVATLVKARAREAGCY